MRPRVGLAYNRDMAEGAQTSLFHGGGAQAPLAERMRPRTLAEMVGQARLLAEDSALRRAVESGRVHSMVLWGPPGCGKTTLALLLANYAQAEFKALSAVLCGLPEVRKVLAEAQARFEAGTRTVLFVDEVHRFNKVQQDAFLPHIERGSIVFVGATTENPSFELNSALLSRCRVHVLEPVSADDLVAALRRALGDAERGLGGAGVSIDEDGLALIAQAADGDVRRALTLLEIAAELAGGEGGASPKARWPRCWPTAPGASTRVANSSSTRSPPCTSRCAAPTPTRRCTGCAGCSTAAATRSTWRAG